MTLIYLAFTFSSYSFIVGSGPNISTNTAQKPKTFYSVAIGQNSEKKMYIIYMRQIGCRIFFQSHAIRTVKRGTIIKQHKTHTM